MSSSSQNRWWQYSVFCKEAVKLLKEDKIHGVRPFPIDCVVVREEKQAMGLDRRAHWVEQWESLGTGPSLSAGHSAGTCWIPECDTGAWLQNLILTPARLSVRVTCLGRAHLCPSGPVLSLMGRGVLTDDDNLVSSDLGFFKNQIIVDLQHYIVSFSCRKNI